MHTLRIAWTALHVRAVGVGVCRQSQLDATVTVIVSTYTA